METIDVQNRSFVVRWVKCTCGDKITYQVKPLKKSIELGIYKKSKNTDDHHFSSVHIASDAQSLLDYTDRNLSQRNDTIGKNVSKNSMNAINNSSQDSLDSERKQSKPRRALSLNAIQKHSKELSLKERMSGSGFTLVNWVGHVEGNKIENGVIEVEEEDSFYAFIIDNTSSKNVKKKVLFNTSVTHDQNYKNTHKYPEPIKINSLKTSSPASSRGSPIKSDNEVLLVGQGRYLQGSLLKKRRKKLQGFSKRFFSLDFKYGTLSYYLNNHNNTFRGEIVIGLSTVSANAKTRMIIIDSGMEIWVIKASTQHSWQVWIDALQSCFKTEESKLFDKTDVEALNDDLQTNDSAKKQRESTYIPLPSEKYTEFTQTLKLVKQKIEKCKVESLSYSQVSRPTASYLIGDKYLPYNDTTNFNISSSDSLQADTQPSTSVSEEESSNKQQQHHQLYYDLNYLEEFVSQLLNQSHVLQRDHHSFRKHASMQRASLLSGMSEDEYFDAEETTSNGVIYLPDDTEADDTKFDDSIHEKLEAITGNSILTSSNATFNATKTVLNTSTILDESIVVESKSRSEESEVLTDSVNEEKFTIPWSGNHVKRRYDVKKAETTPPSLLSFLRKNVGKDLSSVAMPVTANEPISILQLVAESFEYSNVLSMISESDSAYQPLAMISAFAISTLSIYRDKTRVMRKPFTPLLGETYEYVSPEMQFRLIVEKVSHKPQIFALHAEHEMWECSYTVTPVQKFWGKSVELNNEGVMKLRLKQSDELYEWSQPTTILKNLIAGEKYIEPIDEVTITASNGGVSKIVFANSGMFGGRSEDVTVAIQPTKKSGFDDRVIVGKWTESLKDKNSGKTLWKVGNLVENSKQKYGFSVYTANLNEITEVEESKLPPTDSRFRPDIRSYENGYLEEAESQKLHLEQLQRDRRTNKADVKPKYFVQVSDSEWRYKKGPESYWQKRERNDWSDVTPLW